MSRVVRVGRTYLASANWQDLEGPNWVLNPWTDWVKGGPGRILALNVPMVANNEPGQLSRSQISTRLQQGANGQYNHHFRTLAERLVVRGGGNTTLVLGWEMTGFDFGHRAEPNPAAWREYWRQIVGTMRAVSGANFIFCFAPNRGPDLMRWQDCWPGDSWVDEFGLSCYDQPNGASLSSYLTEPNGLNTASAFANSKGLKMSFPEWGLFRNGDRAAYITFMANFFRDPANNVRWQSITDYGPHGVWRFTGNPQSSARYRTEFRNP
jgi:hypothetical protein